MSCDTSGNLLDEIMPDIVDILACLDEDGLLPSSSSNFTIVYETLVGADAALGVEGSVQLQKERMRPSPRIRNTVTTEIGDSGVQQKSGTLNADRIPASDVPGVNYTRAQLESAAYFLVWDSPYQLLSGSLTREANGGFWSMQLVRKEQNDFLKA